MICCLSSHSPPDTACREFLKGMNGRCVYCDHEEKCHPGPGATCWIGSNECDNNLETEQESADIAYFKSLLLKPLHFPKEWFQ